VDDLGGLGVVADVNVLLVETHVADELEDLPWEEVVFELDVAHEERGEFVLVGRVEGGQFFVQTF
jgi:hypothetical protein